MIRGCANGGYVGTENWVTTDTRFLYTHIFIYTSKNLPGVARAVEHPSTAVKMNTLVSDICRKGIFPVRMHGRAYFFDVT